MIAKLSRQFKIDARIFSAASHVFSLLYGHAAHALSLSDICDALMVHEPEFLRVRGATPPARNTFSNANRTGLYFTRNSPVCPVSRPSRVGLWDSMGDSASE